MCRRFQTPKKIRTNFSIFNKFLTSLGPPDWEPPKKQSLGQTLDKFGVRGHFWRAVRGRTVRKDESFKPQSRSPLASYWFAAGWPSRKQPESRKRQKTTKTTETASNKRVECGMVGKHRKHRNDEKPRESGAQTTGSPNNGFRNTRFFARKS